ncbi:MAG: hypothetical protein JSU59_05440 [Nitrospirota bacterium]|nr:MAG: hypothetical protein JSU59_05440 [Nitrospirota bacterium]
MSTLSCLVLVGCLSMTINTLAHLDSTIQENADYTVAVFVWGNSDTPLAQEITDRLRLLGFTVPDPTMHKGSRYSNYTDRVEIRYTTRGQAKLPIILQELEKIPGLTVESKLFTSPEDQTFSLAGDIQIQFPIILP